MSPRKLFANQVALITGAATGIGYSVAQRFAADGAKVVLLDVNKGLLESARAQLNEGLRKEGYVSTFEADVTCEHSMKAAVEHAVEFGKGRLDIAVAAAGITGQTNLKTQFVDVENFKRVMDINVTGVFLTNKLVIPHMLKNNYGRIINVASISGKEGNEGMSAYSASKAAVIGLTKATAKEYATAGITCNAIAPAVIQTAMVAALPSQQVKYMTDKIPMSRTGTLSEVASMVAFIGSKDASFTTGFTFDLSGGRATY